MWLALPTSNYYGTADFLLSSSFCKTPITGSQTFLNLYPFVKPLGCCRTPRESDLDLNYSSSKSSWVFQPMRCIQKNEPYTFSLSSPSFDGRAITMLHSFPLLIAIGFGNPHHYYPCHFWFRFSDYVFTTLQTL